ncbi:hypothetical protein AB0K00_52370 [Dactylosporangium sp. NPDC049525]|uniref:hypothetical protein n=1 Tax=Dactylosporangium sp. NPDC049525 TaxID=3154730 RepID=UPI003425B9CD
MAVRRRRLAVLTVLSAGTALAGVLVAGPAHADAAVGITRSVVYHRAPGGGWVSVDSQMCGFMPLRGGAADDPHSSLDLSGDGRVCLDVCQDQHLDA